MGTPWRQANWRFLATQVGRLAGDAVLLDVGAGRGDFADALHQRSTIALDVYPYPEVDVVCDLAEANPFQAGSFDGVVLMNVLEHVYDSHALLEALSQLLKPGGVLLVAVPFMVKIHQAPVDFARYTHYALDQLGRDHGLEVESLEGYYDPVFFLGEGLGNLRWAVLPTLKGVKRYPARLLMAGIQALAVLLGAVLGNGRTQPPEKTRSSAPTGYHVVYRKKE
jgi:SAM-dependent methyltransferase